MRDHPAEKWLEAAVRRFSGRYAAAQEKIAAQLDSYARRHGWKTYGLAWSRLVRTLAVMMYETNAEAMNDANAERYEAFSEGANVTGWQLSGGGYTRGGGAGRGGRKYDPMPFTPETARLLSDAGLLEIAKKAVKRQKDIAWSERQIKSVVNAMLISRGASGGGGYTRGGGARREPTEAAESHDLSDVPKAAAQRITAHARRTMTASAQFIIFSSYDGGVYTAGLEASSDGFDVEKTWLGIPDTRIRDSHRHLHGTTVPIDGLFYGFDGVLRYPHDPAAPPSETMNCRCRIAVHLAGTAPRAASELRPSQVSEYRKWRDDAIRAAGTNLMEAHRRRLNGNIHR